MSKYNVFAYGELMKKERLLELINRIPKMIKGRVYNYEKFFDETIGYYEQGKKREVTLTVLYYWILLTKS